MLVAQLMTTSHEILIDISFVRKINLSKQILLDLNNYIWISQFIYEVDNGYINLMNDLYASLFDYYLW